MALRGERAVGRLLAPAPVILLIGGLLGSVVLAGVRSPGSVGFALAGILTAAMTAGMVLLLGRSAGSEMGKRLSIAGDAAQLGLVECIPDSSLYDFTAVICESKKLVVVLNDGRTWCSVHRDRLRKRLEDPSKCTTIYLIHPESDFISVLARKGSTEPETIRTRIGETVAMLEKVCTPGTQLELLGHNLFNPHALVLSESKALLTPYFTSRGGRTVPLFVFEDSGPDSFYRLLASDVEGLRMDSEFLVTTRTGAGDASVLPLRRDAQ